MTSRSFYSCHPISLIVKIFNCIFRWIWWVFLLFLKNFHFDQLNYLKNFQKNLIHLISKFSECLTYFLIEWISTFIFNYCFQNVLMKRNIYTRKLSKAVFSLIISRCPLRISNFISTKFCLLHCSDYPHKTNRLAPQQYESKYSSFWGFFLKFSKFIRY